MKNKAKKATGVKKVAKFITKEIGGEKNGGSRKVYLKRRVSRRFVTFTRVGGG